MIDLCNSDNLLIIRAKIKERCKLLGFTQKVMLANIGKYETFLSEVWSGRRNLTENDINAISDYLKTTPDYLCGLTNDPTRPHDDTKKLYYEFVKSFDSDKPSYDRIINLSGDLREIIRRLSNATDGEIKQVLGFMDLIGIK